MGKIAFVFSGQGDQYPGMGQDLYETSAPARRVFDLCEKIRPGTLDQCFRGSEEELKETKNTQPCLSAMELAAAADLHAKGVWPELTAGFSLGEVVACIESGRLDLEKGFGLICRRGEIMEEAAASQETFMAAVLKLPEERLEAITHRFTGIYPVNFNCPGQITAAGLASQKEDFLEEVRHAGGRAVPLKVSGAFHSPFMKEAAAAFREELEQVLGEPKPCMGEEETHIHGVEQQRSLWTCEKDISKDQKHRTSEGEKSVSLGQPEREAAKAAGKSGDPGRSEGLDTGISLYANLTGDLYGTDLIDTLSRQICSPVRWEETIRSMIRAGADTFIEIGPGKTLTGMIRKISPDVTALTYVDYLAEFRAC